MQQQSTNGFLKMYWTIFIYLIYTDYHTYWYNGWRKNYIKNRNRHSGNVDMSENHESIEFQSVNKRETWTVWNEIFLSMNFDELMDVWIEFVQLIVVQSFKYFWKNFNFIANLKKFLKLIILQTKLVISSKMRCASSYFTHFKPHYYIDSLLYRKNIRDVTYFYSIITCTWT